MTEKNHQNINRNLNELVGRRGRDRSWIYNYMCNQCLSPLKLWVWTPFMVGCTRYNIMW